MCLLSQAFFMHAPQQIVEAGSIYATSTVCFEASHSALLRPINKNTHRGVAKAIVKR
jgi:hypothetical protein